MGSLFAAEAPGVRPTRSQVSEHQISNNLKDTKTYILAPYSRHSTHDYCCVCRLRALRARDQMQRAQLALDSLHYKKTQLGACVPKD